jgi:hypothetical protein
MRGPPLPAPRDAIEPGDAIELKAAARNRSSLGNEAELLRDQDELQGDGLNGAVSFISLLILPVETTAHKP